MDSNSLPAWSPLTMDVTNGDIFATTSEYFQQFDSHLHITNQTIFFSEPKSIK